MYVNPTVVSDASGAIPIRGATKDAKGVLATNDASIRADFDFANQIYSQIGISVVTEPGHKTNVLANHNISFPVDVAVSTPGKEFSATVRNTTWRSPGQSSEAIAAFYVASINEHSGGKVREIAGRTAAPNDAGVRKPGVAAKRSLEHGILLADSFRPRPEDALKPRPFD